MTVRSIEPFECHLPLMQGYYVVHSNRSPLRKVGELAKRWLIEEAQATALENKRQDSVLDSTGRCNTLETA